MSDKFALSDTIRECARAMGVARVSALERPPTSARGVGFSRSTTRRGSRSIVGRPPGRPGFVSGRTGGFAEPQRLGPRFRPGLVRFRIGMAETSRSGADEIRAGVLETGRRTKPAPALIGARENFPPRNRRWEGVAPLPAKTPQAQRI
jgi:hypothetical protein